MPKISNLPAAASAIATDLVAAVQGGVTKKETLAQILTLYSGTIVITEAQVTGLVADLASKLAKASNLSDVASAATSRTNLGLAIGTNVEAWSAVLDAVAAGTYTGAASITTLGTIVTGTWNASVIALAYGGTNNNLTAANGAVPYCDASKIVFLAPGSAGQIPRSGGAGALTWSTATYPATAGTLGNVLKSDGTNFVSAADTPGALTNTHILVGDGSNVAQDVPVSGDATMANTGALSVISVTGTTTNDNAAAGKVGEFISSEVAEGAPVAITNATPADITSISLTAGDWDVWGNVAATCAAGTIMTLTSGWVSVTSATRPNAGLRSQVSYNPAAGQVNVQVGMAVPYQRISLGSTTTVYLSIRSDFTVSTMGACGAIYARRAR